jgi:hypothetical protein
MQRTALALTGLWTLTGVAALSLWLIGVANAPLALRETVIYRTEPIGEIRGSQTVGQSFKAPYHGLYRIEVSLADYGRRNTGQVVFRLKPARELPIVLVEKTFAAEDIRGDVMYAITFAPQPDSAGRVYYFELEAPKAVSGDAITAYLRPHDPYSEGSAFWSGNELSGDLVFAAHFQPKAWDRLQALFTQIAASKPWPWNSAGFYVALTVLWIGALVVALWRITPARLTEAPKPRDWSEEIARRLRDREDALAALQQLEPLMSRIPPAPVRLEVFLLAILLLVFVRSLLFSSVIPPWLGPDETGHFEYVALIHSLQRIPVPLPETEIIPELTREINASAEQLRYEQFFDLWRTFGIRSLSEQEPPRLVGPREAGYQRPFYYLLLTPIYALVAGQDILVRYFTLAAASGLLAAFTVWMAAKTAATLFPRSLFVQALTPLIIAFWPTQVMMSSRINNDNLATATAALTMWVMVIAVQRGLTWKNGLGLGLCALLAILAKGSTVFLTPLIVFAAFLGALQRWGGFTPARNRAVLSAVAIVVASGSVGLLAVFIWPETPRWLMEIVETVLWPSRSRDWIMSALAVLAGRPIFTPTRLDANLAESLRLLMLFWFPYGWRKWLPTDWLALASWVFAVALWLGGLAWLGIGSAARRLASGCQSVEPGRLWALGLLALAVPLAFAPLFTRMVIDPFAHWWNGRILMTLLTPAAIFVAFGLQSLTPASVRVYAWHSVVALLVLIDAFCLGFIILPGYYG